MNMQRYLAFDLGASSGRAILGAFDGRRMHMREIHRFPTPMIVHGESLYWDLDAVWVGMQEALRRLVATGIVVQSLSVDSWGLDYVPLGADMRPVRRAHCYRDPRTNGMDRRAAQLVAEGEQYAITGVQAMSFNTLYQVLADKLLAPEIFAATACRLLIADYFNFRFTGRTASEASLASTTQLLDPGVVDWAADLMHALGFNPVTWPEIVLPGTVLGPVRSAEAVHAVAGCSHDTACAVAAVPAEAGSGSWAFLSSGTWSLMGVELQHPIRTEAARLAGFTNEVGFGGTIRLLKNLTGLWILQECERAWREQGVRVGYGTLLAEALEAEQITGYMDVGDVRFAQRANMPSVIRTYCREHAITVPETRGSLVRLILGSLAEKYRQVLRQLEDLLGHRLDILHVVGGGSRNALLNQWTADCCNCLVVAGPAEATALGNLLIQARAMQDVTSSAALREVARSSSDLRVYCPKP